MTTAYTSLLGLALPVTGELSGTWGDTVNNSITSLVDSAVAGTTTLNTDADVTLTTTTGAANTSREAILLWTAGGTVTRTITAPAQSKTYVVINASSSTQSIKLVGAGPTAGVTIVKGESAVCAWNGTDFVKVSNASGAGVFTSLTDSGLTPTRVTYATTGGLLTDSANMTFDGTTLTAAGFAGPHNGTVGATTANTGAFTTLSASSTVSGTGFTNYLASPPAIGGTAAAAITGTTITANTGFAGPLNGTVGATTANTGAFTTLSASSTVSGTGFSTYLASPPAIGGTTAAAGAFTTLSASSTVSGTGFSTYLASPPAIGGTTAAAGAFTTLSASSTVSGTGFSTYLASPPAIGGTTAAAGSFSTLSYTGTLTGGTGVITIGTTQFTKDANGKIGVGTASPTSLFQTTGSSSVSAFKTPNIAEVDTIAATAATGTINYDVTTQSVQYYTSNATGNWTLNFRGSSGTSLNTLMQTGECISATFLVTNGSTAYYNSAVTIDGTSVTPKWQGGSAPTSGNASSTDCYTYVIQKTGSATYVVLASQTKFA